ncbi:hypothetical protein [Campylobacter lanienae]|uniref:hypothetical protein n=1 Tax=Campylobacter lanienae TaxID=75658 RepID=UPI0024316E31|nr:hypothetical protein [Campylobacter lanienae]MDD5787017.1 hypothetical protein [Campylobacter lanienae]
MNPLKLFKPLLTPKVTNKPYILGADGIKYSTKFYIVMMDAIYTRRGGKLITKVSR